MNKTKVILRNIVFSLAPLFAAPAIADTFPRIEGAVPIEIHNDWNHRSDSADNEHNQMFLKTEPEITIRVAPGLLLYVHAVIEPVRAAGRARRPLFRG